MKIRRACSVSIVLSLVLTCVARAEVAEEDFGKTHEGTPVRLFTLSNKNGMVARIMTYGATIVSLNVPDKAGKTEDLVIGFDKLDDYLRTNFTCGVLGRYANRIAGAKFTLDGVEYKLPANNGPNTLHGGKRGFDKVVWDAKKIDDHAVEFTYLSKDAEEGFPGNLTTHVRYSLNDANELKLEYSATTDKDTVVNLSNHAWFNLAGHGSGPIVDHELMIDADQYTPANAQAIPTGQIVPVEGTPFDFRQAHKIGQHIEDDNEQLRFGRGGYDHNFVLNKKEGLRLAATLYDPGSGRVMEVLTTQPAIQIYTANGLNGSLAGKAGRTYSRRGAICLETQHYPDSPNHPDFPTTVLKPGETFASTTVYRFSTR